jgi:hypothetical protein
VVIDIARIDIAGIDFAPIDFERAPGLIAFRARSTKGD